MPKNRIALPLAERRIDDSIRKVRESLIAIRDSRLHRPLSFYEYCAQQFNFSREDVNWYLEFGQ